MENYDDKRAGFTLIEIIVVLAISALVFSVGAISLASLKGRATPERSAAEIARLMNAVHMQARDQAGARSVLIDLEAKRVSTPDGSRTVQVPGEYALSVIVGRETVSDEKSLEVHFLPDGTSSGAEILITDPVNRRARIDINWLTGLARVDDGRP